MLIFQSWMNFIQCFIYLIQIIKKIIHAKMTFIHMKSFVYGHIHPCRWIEITLNFKFRLYVHAQTILNF